MNREDKAFFGHLTAELVASLQEGSFDVAMFNKMQFRMNWKCPAEVCGENHMCRGSWEQLAPALAVMVMTGFPHIQVRLESYAMEMDAIAAEAEFPSDTPSDSPHQP